jgi:hypothetical protein
MNEAHSHEHAHHSHGGHASDHGGVAGRPSINGHGGHDHGAMVADYRRRFWVSLALTPPVLLLSPMIRDWLGLAEILTFPGDDLVLFALSTVVYVYGGWPFLTGFSKELRARKPGMMTLIALAISVAPAITRALGPAEPSRVGVMAGDEVAEQQIVTPAETWVLGDDPLGRGHAHARQASQLARQIIDDAHGRLGMLNGRPPASLRTSSS